MDNINGFCLGGFYSRDYGIIMTEPPKIVFAERDTESLSVAGMSGDLTRDNGRYKNVTIPYKCAIFPKNSESLREAAISALELLRPKAGYARLENTYHPESFRFGRISSQISIDSIVEQAGKFTVNFDCKPQRFLISGEAPFEFLEPSFLVNPTQFAAKPVIEVFGTGAGNLVVGGTIVEIKELTDQLVLDCETMNAYRQVGDAAPENKNSCIYAPEFPELMPGENTVSWDGEITSVKITPRWWTL